MENMRIVKVTYCEDTHEESKLWMERLIEKILLHSLSNGPDMIAEITNIKGDN